MFAKKALSSAMIKGGQIPTLAAFNAIVDRIIDPVTAPKKRMTFLNYDQQKERYEAAEAKRLRKQMKRLADAGLSGEQML